MRFEAGAVLGLLVHGRWTYAWHAAADCVTDPAGCRIRLVSFPLKEPPGWSIQQGYCMHQEAAKHQACVSSYSS